MHKKVLVLGKGGREHAMVEALKRSPQVGEVFVSPGNGGTQLIAKNVAIPLVAPFLDLIQFVKEKEIDMVVVGPEEYLVSGVVDRLKREGIKIFGPTKKSAMLEGSKIYAKEMMRKAGVPNAPHGIISSKEEAMSFVKNHSLPLVFKADGLAAGKGVFVCTNKEELNEAMDVFFEEKRFGENRLLIETFLKGFEASLLVMSDGKDYKTFPFCQDHKRLYDGDVGPNTGGMGVYLPVKGLNEKLLEKAKKTIIEPMIKLMKEEGHIYKGILYIGLMVDGEELNVVEFNCRFGDPEAQCLLPLLESDFYEVLLSSIEGRLSECEFKIKNESSCVVVLASGGYPEDYEKGKEIILKEIEGVHIYHAGTQIKNGKLLSDGGRVLCFSAQAKTLKEAIDLAYRGVHQVEMEGAFFREDIGKKGL